MLKKFAIPSGHALVVWCLMVAGHAQAEQLQSNDLLMQDAQVKAVQQPKANDWRYVLGIGGGYTRAYEGSDEFKTMMIPVINIDYKQGLFFLNVRDGIGSYPLRGKHYKVGASIAYVPAREERDDRTNLHGMGDTKASATANILTEYDFGIVKIAGRYTTALSGDYGTTVRLNMSSRYPLTRNIILMGSVYTIWADEEHMNNRFGVTDMQSVASGYEQYRLKAGTKSIGGTIGVTYLISKEWSANLTVSGAKLMDEVIDSPVVKDEFVPVGFLTLNYRF